MSKLYIGNLSWNTDTDGLRSRFSQFGNVTDAIVMRDRETGRSRGFGFVTFESDADANSAVSAMNGAEVDGRNISVAVAQQREGGFSPREGGFRPRSNEGGFSPREGGFRPRDNNGGGYRPRGGDSERY